MTPTCTLIPTCTLLGPTAHVVNVRTKPHSVFTVEVPMDAHRRETVIRVQSALGVAGETTPGKVLAWLENLDDEFVFPLHNITHLDLAFALAAAGVDAPEGWAFAAELSMSGDLRTINGAAPMARALKAEGFQVLVVAEDNAEEVEGTGLAALAATSLKDVMALCLDPPKNFTPREFFPYSKHACDFAEIAVNPEDTWPLAVEVAAAGGHSLLLEGEPGSGKTMVARRMATILDLDEDTKKEVTDTYSATGLLRGHAVNLPPFRAPHHTISGVGMAGNRHAGETALAHGGVLFLDEAPEFRRSVLETVRNQRREKVSRFANSQGVVTYPTSFMLVASVNPCPCGFATSATRRMNCTCTSAARDKLHARLEPLNLDIRVQLKPVSYKDIQSGSKCETSKAIRERVSKARAFQVERQGCLNSELPFEGFDPTTRKLMRIARTLADLDQPNGPADEVSDEITLEHVDLARVLLND